MPVVSVSSEMRCRHSPVNSQCALSPVGAATPWSTRTLPVPAGGQVERRLELLLQGNSPKCPKGLFLLGKILLLPPYKERPVLSHSPPLQLDQGLSRSGSHTAQLSTLPSYPPPGLHGFITSSLFPSLRFQATRSVLVLLKPCFAREGSVSSALSQESCGRPSRCRPALVPGTFLS